MDFQLPDGAPAVLRWLVYMVIGSAGLVSLWKNLKKLNLLKFIAREMNPPVGESMRELVSKTAADVKVLTEQATAAAKAAKAALELSQRMDGRTRRIVAKQKEYSAKVDEIIVRVNNLAASHSELRERLDKQDEKFARFVVHEARNDLFKSTLLEEEQRLLEENGEKEKQP